jgi:hypothetical protein
MTKPNPKLEGSNIVDCIPQVGPCPNNCNQCYYNRPGAFYVPIDQPSVPTPEEVGDRIVRMNCGHDSNIEWDKVIETAKRYRHFFFNTSIPNLNFPGPVVLTVNPNEESPIIWTSPKIAGTPNNLMFVRFRVSPTNIEHVWRQSLNWTGLQIPVVLTFMAYYDREPVVPVKVGLPVPCYEWKVRHVNSYWCPTPAFIALVMDGFKHNRLVSVCGTKTGPFCRDCHNCESYYWNTIKRMQLNEK